jgi:hypothetical protein
VIRAQRLRAGDLSKAVGSPPTRRARTRTRATVSALVQWGIRWVGTGLAPGGFAGMACL